MLRQRGYGRLSWLFATEDGRALRWCGGWALLAHLGFTAAPAPLDWLTMFWVTTLAGVFVAIGQRGLMTMR